MRQLEQLAWILLYLQLFARDVSTLDSVVSPEEHTSDANQGTQISIWECNSNDECTAANSTCLEHLCQCEPGYILTSDLTACVKIATKLHDSCEDNLQCSAYLFNGAKCVNNICVCGSGYYYLHGRCNRYVGLYEKCKYSIDCYVNADFEASTCNTVEGICKCSAGFYQREYRTCRREGKDVGDECMIDLDCTSNNTYCNETVCAEKPKIDETIEFSYDIELTGNDITNKQIQMDRNCANDVDCKGFGNAVCDFTGTCRCARAHFELDTGTGTKCIPELGESCNTDDDVNIENSICRGETWSCTNGMVVSVNNRECLKATKEYNKHCQKDEQCYIFGPDAECIDEECICNEKSRYITKEMFCWTKKDYGESCIQNQDCYIRGFRGELICKDGICSCPKDNQHLNRLRTACINSSAEIGEPCAMDTDCVTPNTICKDDVCECKKNYYQDNQRCMAGINSTCDKNKDCKPENSSCVSKVCTCNPNYVAVNAGSCLPISSYGKSCLEDIQCSINIPNAICKAKQKDIDPLQSSVKLSDEEAEKYCTCNETTHYRFRKCFTKKLLNEACTNLGECYILGEIYDQDKVACENGKCACRLGYMKSDEFCVKDLRIASFLGDGAINAAPMGLLSIVLLIFSCHFL